MFSHWTNYSSYENGKCVSTMLNTGNWVNFVDTNVADYAIGGPTLEMFCESWNAKYSSTPMYWNVSTSNSSYGYFLATTQNSTSSYSVDMGSTAGAQDTLYFSRATGAERYWLSSPSANNNRAIVFANRFGGLSRSPYSHTEQVLALRPLVRLQSGVTLTENTTITGIDYDINAP